MPKDRLEHALKYCQEGGATKKRKSRKQIKHAIATKNYFDRDSETYLNEKQSLIKAGYSPTTAKAASGTLLKDVDLRDILPDDAKDITEELKKWMELMASWRRALSLVEDPTKIGSRTFGVISAHIERLSKIFALIVERTESRSLNINITMTEEQMEFFLRKQKEKEEAIDGQK